MPSVTSYRPCLAVSCACRHKLGFTVSGQSPSRKLHESMSHTTRPSAVLTTIGSSVPTKPRSALTKSLRSLKSAATCLVPAACSDMSLPKPDDGRAARARPSTPARFPRPARTAQGTNGPSSVGAGRWRGPACTVGPVLSHRLHIAFPDGGRAQDRSLASPLLPRPLYAAWNPGPTMARPLAGGPAAGRAAPQPPGQERAAAFLRDLARNGCGGPETVILVQRQSGMRTES